jgi:hypothetical protein
MPIYNRELKEAGIRYFSGASESFATTLAAILMKAYGPAVLEWDGLTIEMQVKDDFGVEMPRLVYDKLMALITALATDSIYKDVVLFDETVSALNGEGVGVERDIPSVDDVAWTVAELRINDPDPVGRDPKKPWSPDIQKYVRVVLDDEGLRRTPRILDFAAERGVPKEGMDDVDHYAATWESQSRRADEIDKWVEDQIVVLIQQLVGAGIEITTSS